MCEKNNDMLRLNKFLAQAGFCSRRMADAIIAEGKIKVNNETATPGMLISPGKDRVSINGKIIEDQKNTKKYAYLLLNKPVQVVSTVSDPQNRATVMDFVPESFNDVRLFPVGRLDYFSEGLLILTNHGELTYRLTHPKWHLPKKYCVKVRGDISPEIIKRMEKGMTLTTGEKLAPVKTHIVKRDTCHTTLEMVLYQGINRQIRRMCEDANLTVLSLKRTEQGPIKLGNLQKGTCRCLTEEEVSSLFKAVHIHKNF